jgi:hypothetical protein
MSSWRTTTLGVLTILGALTAAGVALLNGHQPDMATTGTALTTGIGLILAADHKNLPPRP